MKLCEGNEKSWSDRERFLPAPRCGAGAAGAGWWDDLSMTPDSSWRFYIYVLMV